MDTEKILSSLRVNIDVSNYAYVYSHFEGARQAQSLRLSPIWRRKCIVNLKEEPVKISKKKGTIAGAVSLIIGTSIGSGILALPKKTSPAVSCSSFFTNFGLNEFTAHICR